MCRRKNRAGRNWCVREKYSMFIFACVIVCVQIAAAVLASPLKPSPKGIHPVPLTLRAMSCYDTERTSWKTLHNLPIFFSNKIPQVQREQKHSDDQLWAACRSTKKDLVTLTKISMVMISCSGSIWFCFSSLVKQIKTNMQHLFECLHVLMDNGVKNHSLDHRLLWTFYPAPVHNKEGMCLSTFHSFTDHVILCIVVHKWDKICIFLLFQLLML